MTIDDARAIVLALPGAVEGFHHGHPDFRIGKSIFGSLWPDKGTAVLRLPGPIADAFEAESPGSARVVSRPKDGSGWLSLTLAAADPEEFKNMAIEAHRLLERDLEARNKR